METPTQRRERWRRLRDHLRDRGMEDIPDDCLEEPKPEWHTRPGVLLVAYILRVKHKAVGRAANITTLPLTVAIFALMLALLAGIQTVESSDLASIGGLIANTVYIVVAVGLAIGFAWSARKLKSVEAPFYFDLEELSLELPTGTRHVPWSEVYSVAPDAEEQDQLRVQLRDGVAVLVYLDEPDRKLLEELMVELILQHR